MNPIVSSYSWLKESYRRELKIYVLLCSEEDTMACVKQTREPSEARNERESTELGRLSRGLVTFLVEARVSRLRSGTPYSISIQQQQRAFGFDYNQGSRLLYYFNLAPRKRQTYIRQTCLAECLYSPTMLIEYMHLTCETVH